MSLYTRRGRVDVSTSDSEINSIASSGDQSPDEVVEELARMALAGHYFGSPKVYETNEMLRGHGLARRPHAYDTAALSPSTVASTTPISSAAAAGPSPPLSPRREPRSGATSRASRQRTRSTQQRQQQQLPFSSRGTAARMANANSLEADKTADVSRALARMYRHIAREYAAEIKKVEEEEEKEGGAGRDGRGGADGNASGVDGSDDGAAAGGDRPKKSKSQRRKPDELARARLLAVSKVQELRKVEKYHKIKDREEEARKNPKPRPRVPQKAVILGRRLYLEAQEKRKNVKEMQDEQEKQRKAEERKACTFHPSISRYADRLAAAGAYYTLEDRLEDQAVHDEELQRLRVERAVALEKECTFHPTLSLGTQELIAKQRRRRSSRRRSRRRSWSSSSRRRRSSTASAPSHEPFEPGERLYREGAERLLRQQIRQRRAAARQQHHVVGGQLRLTAEEVRDLASRFEAWAASREQRQAQLRDEVDRLAREGSSVAGAAAGPTRVLSRSPSGRTASTARPKNSPFSSRDDGYADSHEKEEEKEEGKENNEIHGESLACTLSQSPPIRSGCLSFSVSRTSAAQQANHHHQYSRNRADFCTTNHEEDDISERAQLDPTTRKQQLRIRLGALFYKYAVSPIATTVSVAEVKQQTQCYYSEDSGVAAALAESFDDEDQRLSKHEFMAALARYVAHHGPQPWCLPAQSSNRSHHTPSNASDLPIVRATTTAAAPGGFFARLNAPLGSVGSSARETEETRAALPAAQPRSSARSAAGSNVGSPSRFVTPADSIETAGDASAAAAFSLNEVAAAPVALSPVSAGHRPLRTHIYRRSRRSASAVSAQGQTGDEEKSASAETALRSVANVDTAAVSNARPSLSPAEAAPAASASASAAAVTETAGTETSPSPPAAAAAVQRARRRLAAHAIPPDKVQAAQLVHGYQGHVERHRRCVERAKTSVTAAENSKHPSKDDEEKECTFHPTLNRHSVALSDMNMEKRMLYACELQLRRKELQLLRASVLKAAENGGTEAVPVTATFAAGADCATTPCARTPKKRAQQEGTSPHHNSMKTPPKPGLPASRSPMSQGQSPSIDLSSFSSATAQGDRSGATVSSGSSAPREELGATTKNPPADTLTEAQLPPSSDRDGDGDALGVVACTPVLLKQAAGKADSNCSRDFTTAAAASDASDLHVVPAPSSSKPHFYTTKPPNAILASDDALTPRHTSSRHQQRAQKGM